MSPRDCERFEERLPLLLYPNELTAAERSKLLAHVEGCGECRAVHEELLVAADQLDALPLESPDAARREGLKARVLEAVGQTAGCPHEAELLFDEPSRREHVRSCAECAEAEQAFAAVSAALDRVELPQLGVDRRARLRDGVLAAVGLAGCSFEARLLDEPDSSEVRAHLAECGSCQEAERAFAGVASALDLVPAATLSAGQRAELKARVLEETGVVVPAGAGAARGQLLRFPLWVTRAAAAVLFASLLGIGYASYTIQPSVRPNAAGDLAAVLELEANDAEKLARTAGQASKELAVLKLAERRYTSVLQRARPRLQHPLVASVALRARHQLAAIRLLNQRASQKGTVTPALTEQAHDVTPDQAILISYGDVVSEYPDTVATLWVIKKYERALSSGKRVIKFDFRDMKFKSKKLEAFVKRQLRRGRTEVLRYDYDRLTQVVSTRMVLDVRMRQAILLQQGLHAEELSNLADARRHYRDVIRISSTSKAGKLAKERLAGLAG